MSSSRRHLLIALALLAGVLGIWLALPAADPPPSFLVTGGETVVFDWSRDACETEDIPDAPVRAFRDAEGRVQLLASHHVARRWIGPSLDDLSHDCAVVFDSDGDPDPTRYDDREWLYSPYTFDGRTVFALVHAEFHGHRRPGLCSAGEVRPCWQNAITLARSTDGGESYTHLPPPEHLVFGPGEPYRPGTGPQGAFSPSNIVRSPRDGLFYALVRLERFGPHARGTTVIRTDDLADPRSWRGWDGFGFGASLRPAPGAQSIPPAEGRAHPAHGGPAPVSREAIKEMTSSLTYNTHLERFLLISLGTERDPASGEVVTGVYYALSEDLVRWSARRLLLEAPIRGRAESAGAPPIGYPSALDPDSPGRNFETTDDRFFLFFTRFNRDDPLDRDLIRVTLEVRHPRS